MPIYEYVCTECNHEIEAIQKMSDDALVFCPECSNDTLKKKISAAAFQLKGTGWYETDFKTKPKSTADEKSSSKKEGADSKSTKSTTDSSKNDKGSSSKQASAA